MPEFEEVNAPGVSSNGLLLAIEPLHRVVLESSLLAHQVVLTRCFVRRWNHQQHKIFKMTANCVQCHSRDQTTNSMSTHLQLNWKINQTAAEKMGQKTVNAKEKYKFREASIKKRIEVEHRKKEPKKRGPKPRPKTQPMSKYRRKTANLRERQRMGEINSAFERLKEKIPTPAQPMNAK